MTAPTAAPPAVELPWHRLDPRMMIIHPAYDLLRLLPALAILLVTGRGEATQLWITGAISAVVLVGRSLTWATTRYRITADRVELHSGVFQKRRRSVPRDRIRTIDLTAKPLHRLLRLSTVEIGAGSTSDKDGLRLDAVSKAEAERLRRGLLHGAPAASPVRPVIRPPVQELARLRWSWIRLAPLTFSSLAGIAALVGATMNLLHEADVDVTTVGPVTTATDRLSHAPLWLGVLVLALLVIAVAAVGSTALFVGRWTGYRLTREVGADGTSALRVRGGLLTRRSLSVADDRLRGVEIVEPLLLRAGGGARARALSAGLTKHAENGVLQPAVPVAEAHRVAAAALRADPAEITLAPLRRHPRAALQRRLTRAMGPAAVAVVAGFGLGALLPELSYLGPALLVLFPPAALLAVDRYRNLGHRLTAGYLVTRYGSLVRRTVALRRSGIIGWTVRQSPFQRRAGLVTLEAVTAAGRGGYPIVDLSVAEARALIDEAAR